MPKLQYRYDIAPPTSDDIKNAYLAAFQHTPQTQSGQFAQDLGEIVPAFMGGMGTLRLMNRDRFGPMAEDILNASMMNPETQPRWRCRRHCFPRWRHNSGASEPHNG